MYGQPLKPNECLFEIGVFDNFDNEITIIIEDLTDSSNDDVREVDHADFDFYWENMMENVFSSTKFRTMKDAKDWCISIGMKFDCINDESDITDENRII